MSESNRPQMEMPRCTMFWVLESHVSQLAWFKMVLVPEITDFLLMAKQAEAPSSDLKL